MEVSQQTTKRSKGGLYYLIDPSRSSLMDSLSTFYAIILISCYVGLATTELVTFPEHHQECIIE